MHALYNSEATEPEAMEEVIKRGDQNGKKIFSYNIKFNVISDDYNKTLYNIEDIDTVVTGRVTGHPVQVLKNKLANEFLKLERQNADIEEIEALGRGALAKAVKEVKQGKIDFKVDKSGIVHTSIGKVSFSPDQIRDNAKEFISTLNKLKPTAAKGTYIKSIYLSSTMSAGIKIDPKSVDEI